MTRRLKIYGGLIAALAVLVSVCLVGGWLYLRSESGRQWLTARFRTEAAGLGLELKLDKLRVAFPFTIRLSGAEVPSRGRRLLSAREMSLTLDPGALLAFRVEVAELALTDPLLSLPLPDSAESSSESKRLVINRLVIENGRVDPAGGWGPILGLSGLTARGRLVVGPSGPGGRISVKQLKARLQGLPDQVSGQGLLRLAEERLQFDGFQVSARPGTMALDGWLDWSGELEMEVRAACRDLEPGRLGLKTLGGPALPEGPAAFEISVKGRPLGRLDLEARLSRLEGRITARGWLDILAGQWDLKGDFSELGLDFIPTAQGLGPLSGSYTCENQKTARLDLRLDKCPFRGVELAPAGLRAELDKGRVRVESLEIGQGSGRLIGRGWFEPDRGDLQAELSFENLTPSPALAKVLPSWLAPARLTGRLTVQGRWPHLSGGLELKNSRPVQGLELGRAGFTFLNPAEGPGLKVQGELERVTCGGFSAERVKLEALWARGELKLKSLSAELGRGSLTARGRLKARTLEHHLWLHFKDLEPGRKIPAWLPGWAARARLTGELTASGVGSEISGSIRLTDSRLASGVEVTRLEAKGAWLERGWRLEQGSVKAAWGEFSGRGRADGRAGDFTFRLKAADLAGLAGQLAAFGLELPGRPAGGLEAAGHWLGPWLRPGGRLSAGFRQFYWYKVHLAKGDLKAALDNTGGRVELQAELPLGRLALSLTSPDPWAAPLKAELSRGVFAPQGQAAWEQSGRAGLEWLKRRLSLSGLALKREDEVLNLSGRINTSAFAQAGRRGSGSDKTASGPLLVEGGRAEYRRGEAFHVLVRDLEVELDHYQARTAQGQGPDWLKDLRATDFKTQARAEELVIDGQRFGRVSLTAENRAGLMSVKPLELDLAKGRGRVVAVSDFSRAEWTHELSFELPGARVESLFKLMDLPPNMTGMVDLNGRLTTRGNSLSTQLAHLSGQVSLKSNDLILKGYDVDQRLDRLERNQQLGLIDVSMSLISGPLNLILGTILDRGGKPLADDVTSHIRQLSADWAITNGLAQARDVAFATHKHRLAFKGGLDLGKRQYRNFIVGVLNKKGCVKYRQTLNGPLDNPEIEMAGLLLDQVVGPVKTIFKSIKKLVVDENCKPFYSGWVAHPKGRD